MDVKAIEAGLAAYEAYINGPDVIDRRVLVGKVHAAMAADAGCGGTKNEHAEDRPAHAAPA